MNDIEKAAMTMEKFEKQFESLDVQTQLVGEAMGESVANVTPPEDVANLMRAIADEHGLEFESDLAGSADDDDGERRESKGEGRD